MRTTWIIYTTLILLLAGCKSVPVKKPSVAPIKAALVDTQAQIDSAGGSNTKASDNIKTALELANELEILLNKIEKEKK